MFRPTLKRLAFFPSRGAAAFAPEVGELVRPVEKTTGVRWGGLVLFAVASFLSALAPMALGGWLWPNGLSAGTEMLFWPATAINVAGMLRLGLRAWPAVVLGAFFSQLLLGRPWMPSAINSLGNLGEAAAFVAALGWAGARTAPLGSVRAALVFIVAALFAPLCSSLPGAATLVMQGRLPAEEYLPAVGVWSFANATSIVLIAPFLLLAGRESGRRRRWSRELALWLGFGIVAGWFAFHAVFRAGGGVNQAFLVYPFVLYAALRFGLAETAGALLWVMALMYASVVVHAPAMDPQKVPATLWFLQSYGFVLGASGLLLATLTGSRHEAEARLRAEQEKLFEARRSEERARLDALRYQVEPHFLFNSLNSIRAVSSEASRDMITELSEYFRSTLVNRDADRVPLGEELRCARHYLSMQQMRHGDALRVEYRIDEAALGMAVPFFVLQPLVENAVRHGFEQSRGEFCLRVSASLVGETLRVEVANTGRWRIASVAGGSGVGMENVRRRLALVYGDEATLRVIKDPGWVRVQLDMPWRPS